MKSTAYAQRTWTQLSPTADEPVTNFDPATVSDLPEPAQRLLLHSLPTGTPLATTVELDMVGRIRLGSRWMPFTATQILHGGIGFVWRPIVGGRILRFLGADELGPNGARMEFRLFGLIPIVRASGPGTAKSAAGRLAAETVAWLPQGLTPQAGARWTAGTDNTATVSLSTPSGTIDVATTVDDNGHLTEIALQRWNDSADPPTHESFGGAITTDLTTDTGVQVAGSGTVGWQWNTAIQDDGIFFTYRITAARHL